MNASLFAEHNSANVSTRDMIIMFSNTKCDLKCFGGASYNYIFSWVFLTCIMLIYNRDYIMTQMEAKMPQLIGTLSKHGRG